LTNIIIAKGRQLVLQATELHDGTWENLKNKKYSCEKLSTMMDHYINFLQNAINKGIDQALLYSAATPPNHFLRNGNFTRFAEWRFIHRA
jgi:hypothetical protein